MARRSLVAFACLSVCSLVWVAHSFYKANVVGSHEDDLRIEIVKFMDAARPMAGRPSGMLEYAPYERQFGNHKRKKEWSRIARIVLRKAQRENSAKALANLGLLQLVDRRYSEAVKTLRRSLEKDPENVEALIDLAVGYLEEGKSDPFSLVLSLEAVSAALEKRPSSLEAHFNCALVLQELHLKSRAESEWHRFLDLDRKNPSRWGEEASEYLKDVGKKPIADRWRDERIILEAAASLGNEEKVLSIVSRFRQQSRIYAQEEWMTQWATSQLSGDAGRARYFLVVASQVGKALARINEDHSVFDAVASIETRSSLRSLSEIAKGHLLYSAGMEFYEDSRFEDAEGAFRKAKAIFQREESVSPALWSNFWIGASCYYQGKHSEARKKFKEVLDYYGAKRYPTLIGRAAWGEGLLQLVQAQVWGALRSYEIALHEFSTLGEIENQGSVEALMAESLGLGGERIQAWGYRLRALGTLSEFPDSTRFHNLLLESADKLLSESYFKAAWEFSNESLTVAANAKPATAAQYFLLRAKIANKLGYRVASEAMAWASHYINQVPSPSLRKRLEADAIVARYEATGYTEPQSDLATLSQAIGYYDRESIKPYSAFVRLLRARLWVKSGRIAEAEQDLEKAAELYEKLRRQKISLLVESDYDQQWQVVFDELADLRFSQGKYDEAFAIIERARAASIQTSAGMRITSLYEVQRYIPAYESLLIYFVLQDRIVLWIVRADSVETVVVNINSTDLGKRVAKFVKVIQGNKPWAEFVPVAQDLFEILVRPALERLPVDCELTIVPDKVLSSLPFAALVDEHSGRYLVEDRVIKYAQSASLYAQGAKRINRQGTIKGRRWRITVLEGVSEVSGVAMEGEALEELPGAEFEATAVSDLYSEHKLALKMSASKEDFLVALDKSDLVHFTGHATANSYYPSMSGLYFVPLGKDDGSSIFRAYELDSVRHDEIRLLVLSACSTSFSGHSRFDSVSGIAWAFSMAGIPSVLGTFWDVEDSAGIELLLEFHRGLLSGVRGGESLRLAQINQISFARSRPSAWASYRLIGESGSFS